MEPVVVETVAFWKMVSAGILSALPVFLAGFAAFIKLKTESEINARRNDSAHARIEDHQKTQNGSILKAQEAIQAAQTQIENIQATCTERGRLEREIREQIMHELEMMKG